MSIPMIRLELRRNRLAAASAAAAFLVTLPVSRLVSTATGLEARLSLDAALTGWILLGLPLAAALIGASSGAASGSPEARDAESLLPPSPGRRAASAIAASVLLAAAFAAFVLATGAVLGRPPVASPQSAGWGAQFWHKLPIAPLLALATLDVLAGSWVLSRLLGHGVAGGLLALLLTAASGLAVASCYGLELLHHEWGASCYASALALAWAGAAAKVWAGALAARWSERLSGRRTLAAALALLIVPALAIWGRMGAELRMLDAKVLPIGYENSFSYPHSSERVQPSSRSLSVAGEGAVLKTLRGGLVRANAAGTRVLVPERNTGLSDILLEPFDTWIRGEWRDENGVRWIERHVSPNIELWRIEGEKAESKLMTDYGSFSTVAGVPLKHRYTGSREVFVARAEDYFRRGDEAAWFEGYKGFAALRRREAGAGRVACAGKCFQAGGRRWALPGAGEKGEEVYPRDFNGRRAYLVPVLTAQGPQVVLCRADGSTRIAWPSDGSTYRGLPDGTLYTIGKDGMLRAVGPDGQVAAPVDLKLSGAPAALMRRADGKVWLVTPGKLAVLAADGRPVLSRPLPEDIEDAIPLKDGFLVTTKRSAWFSDWRGSLRRVENPR